MPIVLSITSYNPGFYGVGLLLVLILFCLDDIPLRLKPARLAPFGLSAQECHVEIAPLGGSSQRVFEESPIGDIRFR